SLSSRRTVDADDIEIALALANRDCDWSLPFGECRVTCANGGHSITRSSGVGRRRRTSTPRTLRWLFLASELTTVPTEGKGWAVEAGHFCGDLGPRGTPSGLSAGGPSVRLQAVCAYAGHAAVRLVLLRPKANRHDHVPLVVERNPHIRALQGPGGWGDTMS